MSRSRFVAVASVVVLLAAGGLRIAAAQDGTEGPTEQQIVARPGGDLPGDPAIQFVRVAGGLVDPVNLASAGDGSGRLFVVERIGRIRIIEPNGQVLAEPFLDLQDVVSIAYLEQGLLGLAFHPDYENNGFFYVNYTDFLANGDTVVVQYSVSADDPNKADAESGRVLMSWDQPFVHHNGGTIHFGPDGYLYIASGDGGLAGDPYETAQDVNVLLGKILRIQVPADTAQGYAIPEDNPFAASGGVQQSPNAYEAGQTGGYSPAARPEIWHYGLRNPWQFSFDPATGDMYLTDIGQTAWEEINVIPAGSPGGINFGWDFVEGTHCFPPEATECDRVGMLPVAEYEHPHGCSVTGAGVYRGEAYASLDGIYFAADYCTGRVWGLARDDGGFWQFEELFRAAVRMTGAGQGEVGTLYLTSCNCNFSRAYDPFADPQGAVWRLVPADQVPEGGETVPTPEPEA